VTRERGGFCEDTVFKVFLNRQQIDQFKRVVKNVFFEKFESLYESAIMLRLCISWVFRMKKHFILAYLK
jgi:hypothetical protein